MRTDVELKQLAVDIVEGKVFTDRNLTDIQIADNEIRNIFISFGLDGQYTKEDLENGKVAMIYEYLDKSSQKSLEEKGLPAFVTYSVLSQEETEKLSDFIANYENMKAGYGDLVDSDDD